MAIPTGNLRKASLPYPIPSIPGRTPRVLFCSVQDLSSSMSPKVPAETASSVLSELKKREANLSLRL